MKICVYQLEQQLVFKVIVHVFSMCIHYWLYFMAQFFVLAGNSKSTGPIKFYNRGEPYYEFTNFYEVIVIIDEKHWSTTEHYFQAQKFVGTPLVETIRMLSRPREAFDLSRNPRYSHWRRSDWETVKEDVMYKALQAKFTQNEKLRKLLVETGNRQLIEHSPYDSYWGDGGDGTGKNRLGVLLMRLRDEMKPRVISMPPQAGDVERDQALSSSATLHSDNKPLIDFGDSGSPVDKPAQPSSHATTSGAATQMNDGSDPTKNKILSASNSHYLRETTASHSPSHYNTTGSQSNNQNLARSPLHTPQPTSPTATSPTGSTPPPGFVIGQGSSRAQQIPPATGYNALVSSATQCQVPAVSSASQGQSPQNMVMSNTASNVAQGQLPLHIVQQVQPTSTGPAGLTMTQGQGQSQLSRAQQESRATLCSNCGAIARQSQFSAAPHTPTTTGCHIAQDTLIGQPPSVPSPQFLTSSNTAGVQPPNTANDEEPMDVDNNNY